ncbi:MAG: 4-(cytidine 5'-diphospho)-2-C-methyl-D-erythritol kinase [Desulfobacterales bacterium]|nr:4-(cytidine 5'-diphospho)-2-C-methyl-D-erythritol kinase [Desulfobacterales bacterium]
MKKTLRLESPAKINLMLRILRKREDGYHEIQTIFQKITLHDTLRFFLTKEKGIFITTNHPRLPTDRRNLVYPAARAMLERSNYSGGVNINIQKRIPVGAGLGGGSSNAATTLKALNRLLEVNLSQTELMRIGLELGADVPFFFMEGGAVGSGIGERLEKTDLPELWFVLMNPSFEVSTAWAYQNSVLTKRAFHYNIQELLRTSEGIARVLWNDLEAGVSKVHHEITAMKEMLRSAEALGALMSGSGPTVFGVFSGEGGASKAYRKVRDRAREEGWIVLKARSIVT